MAPAISELCDIPGASAFLERSRLSVRLGPLALEIRSNERPFSSLRYFPRLGEAADPPRATYSVNFCNLNLDGPWSTDELLQCRDNTYRAKRFAAGYYITDHFGPPAYLISRGNEYWIFGADFEPILWPYLIKLLLTRYSVEQNVLHLKAAAFSRGGSGTLLVSRGGGGKTVLLALLCRNGARFLSNTHVLVEGEVVQSIPTAMRVRKDVVFGPIISAGKLEEGVKPGEYVADPVKDLGWPYVSTARVNNICLIDYRGPSVRDIREIDREVLYDYMEQFSLALNVYGLKEDILDGLSGDIQRFSSSLQTMKTQLRALVDRCRTYYVSCDVIDSRNLQVLRELLGT